MALFGGKKKGFDWGSAALAFFGGPQVASSIMERKQGEAQRDQALMQEIELRSSLEQEGLPQHVISGIMADPRRVSEYMMEKYKTRQLSPETEVYTPGANGSTANVYRSKPTTGDLEKDYNFLTGIDPTGRLPAARAAKEAVSIVQGVDPATGQTIVQALDPAQLFGGATRGPMGTPPINGSNGLPPGWRLDDEGGAPQAGARPFRRGLFGR